MAREGMQLQDGVVKTVTDLSAKQFFAVKLSAANTVALVAASTDDVYGILQNKPLGTSGAPVVCDVCTEGIAKASAGAAITAGVAVMSNTSGQMIAWTSGSGYCVAGWAIDAAAGANALFTMRVHPEKVIT